MGEIGEAMRRYAATFDPDVHHAAGAAVIVEQAARIEKMAATVKALAAARVADTELWRGDGDRSAAHQLARATGTSVSDAKDTLAAGAKLAEHPDVDRAARQGRLSAKQAAAITDAATADPAKAADLVDLAGQASLRELQEECARVKAAADPDPEQRHRQIHANRSLRQWTGRDGTAHIHVQGTTDRVARMAAAIADETARLFDAARRQEQHEPREAYAFDALYNSLCPDVATAPVPARAATRPKLIWRIDWEAWLRGWPTDGETCDIAGVGPVPASAVRAMLDADNPILAAVVTRGVDVVNVAHPTRRPTAHQRSALEWLSPQCTVLGCPDRARETDHRHDWADTHITLLRWLDNYCDHHHDLKTYQGWALTPGTGKRPMVPPDHPLHPNNAKHGTDPPQRGAA